MIIKVTLHAGALLPARKTEGSAGYDLCALLDTPIRIGPRQVTRIPTGVSLELPDHWEAQIRPRSGLAAMHGITVLNAPGTIDSDYRGEIGVLLINHGWHDFTVLHGDRIAQMVFAQYRAPYLMPVEALGETERGSGGFGSTGT